MKMDDLLNVGKVARVDFDEFDLKPVLDAFSKISEVDTTNIPRSLHPIQIDVLLRSDVVVSCDIKREDFLSLSKSKEAYFLGPSLKW